MSGGIYKGPDGEDLMGDGREVPEVPEPTTEDSRLESARQWLTARPMGMAEFLGTVEFDRTVKAMAEYADFVAEARVREALLKACKICKEMGAFGVASAIYERFPKLQPKK
jgi:hypothetical protein